MCFLELLGLKWQYYHTSSIGSFESVNSRLSICVIIPIVAITFSDVGVRIGAICDGKVWKSRGRNPQHLSEYALE